MTYEQPYFRLLPEACYSNPVALDLTANNPRFYGLCNPTIDDYRDFIDQEIGEKSGSLGFGGYLENRIWYQRSSLFGDSTNPRTIHLGIDLWVAPSTEIYAPFDATVHSFNDNNHFGDYGPTIVLESIDPNDKFCLLLGHLSRSSLRNLKKGDKIFRGVEIATVGKEAENGNWPTHVHVQCIRDMLGNEGDFPGVCALSDLAKYREICSDPSRLCGLTT